MATVERQGNSGAERTINVHPLVLVNITAHVTSKMATPNERIIGALFGVHNGLTVDIYNSSELLYNVVNGEGMLDTAFMTERKELFAAVFPNYELLGWYSTGSEATSGDLVIHKMMTEHNESPLFLQMNPIVEEDAKELPISVYESELHVVNELPTMLFVKAPFKVTALEAERISLDQVSKNGAQEDGMPELTGSLTGVKKSVNVLHQRIAVLRAFLHATREGSIPRNEPLLRQVSSLCARLPAMDSPEFHAEFLNDFNDSLLVTLLASITKGSTLANDVLDKYTVAYSGRRGGRGGGMI